MDRYPQKCWLNFRSFFSDTNLKCVWGLHNPSASSPHAIPSVQRRLPWIPDCPTRLWDYPACTLGSRHLKTAGPENMENFLLRSKLIKENKSMAMQCKWVTFYSEITCKLVLNQNETLQHFEERMGKEEIERH